jgi:hypothetical protein
VIVLTGRPYGNAGIGSSAAWLRVPAEWVALETLVTTQRHVWIDALLRVDATYNPDEPVMLPHVVEWRGVRYLEDGHTRVTLAALRGETEILARVTRPEARSGI